MASAGVDDFWIEVLDALSARLPESDPSTGSGHGLAAAVRHAAETGEVRFMAVRRLLRRVRDAGFDVALCLDEFESLARNPRFEPDFYGELRSLAGELGLVYLTASKRSLYELTYEHSDTLSSPFFNIFSELPLGLMSEDATARNFLTELTSRYGPTFCDDEIAFTLNLAGTHPFFLQIAGFYLVGHAGLGEPRTPEGLSKDPQALPGRSRRSLSLLVGAAFQHAAVGAGALSSSDRAGHPRCLRVKELCCKNRDEEPAPFSPTFAEFLQWQRAEQTLGQSIVRHGGDAQRPDGPHARRLSGARAARARRHGRSVQGLSAVARPLRGAQNSDAALCPPMRPSAERFPARSDVHRQIAPSEHRPGV